MSKLTDILEAIPLCEAYMDGVDDGCNTCPYNGRCKDLVPDTIKMLEDLAKRVPRWISVHDRLPEMHTETYEQVSIPGESIDGVKFLKEGDICEAMVHAATDTILTCEMPLNVVLEVTYTEPGIKGDTATNTLKPATVETGAEVRVPLFINTGDKVRIDTRSGDYIERVK